MYSWWRAAVMAAALVSMAAGMEVIVADKPMTVVIPVPASTRNAEAILLQLLQVTTPKNAQVRIDIFAELPGANTQTSVDSPNFVGYITSLPSLNASADPKHGFIVQVADPVGRRIRTMKTVRLTFVPSAPIAGGGFKIGSIRLEPAVPGH